MHLAVCLCCVALCCKIKLAGLSALCCVGWFVCVALCCKIKLAGLSFSKTSLVLKPIADCMHACMRA